MISEALEVLQETAKKAAGAANQVAVVKLPGEPENVYGLIKSDGSFEKVTAKPGPVSGKLGSITEVGPYVEDAKTRHNADPTVWLDAAGVVIVLDDTGEAARRSRVGVDLAFTPEFQVIKDLAKEPAAFNQRQYVRLLRTKLANCMNEAGELLIRTVRAIDFKQDTTGHSHLAHGRQSLGREVEGEVRSQFGEIPEEITLTVRIYTDPALRTRFAIKCAVEIDALAQEFFLIPLPMAVEDALHDQLQAISDRLENECDCPVFFGRP